MSAKTLPAVRPASLLDGLLERLPGAAVATVGADGRFVPIPTALNLGRRRVVNARWALDLVVSDDKAAVIEAWNRACSDGFGETKARAVGDQSALDIYFVDVREAHGVLVGLFDGRSAEELAAPTAIVAPRFCNARKNAAAVFTSVDPRFTGMFGWEEDEVVGKPSLEFVHPDDHDRAIAAWFDVLTTPGHEHRVRLRHLVADGSWKWIDVSNRNLISDPDHGCVVTEMFDVTDEMAAHDAIRDSERLLHRLADTLRFGVLQLDVDQEVVYANATSARLLRARDTSALSDYISSIAGSDRYLLLAGIGDAFAHGTDTSLTASAGCGEGGHDTRLEIEVRAVVDDAGRSTGVLLCMEDVTDRHALQTELERRATHDALTGCYNRSAVLRELQFALDAQDSTGTGTAVIFIDLDRFKEINDDLGHATGDQALIIAARRLARAVRSDSIVGRLGGDEFVLVCPRVATVEEAHAVARRAAEALNRSAYIGDHKVKLNGSFGVAFGAAGERDAEGLLGRADVAMYDVKGRHERPHAAQS